MKLFENGVGRPSNEVKKKRMLFIISTMIIAVGLIAVSLGFLLTKTNNVSVSRLKGDGPGAVYSNGELKIGSIGDCSPDGFISYDDIVALMELIKKSDGTYKTIKISSLAADGLDIRVCDINSDNKLNQTDLKLLYRMMYSGYQLGDYDQNGVVNINDYYDIFDDVKSYIVKTNNQDGIPVSSLKENIGDINNNGSVDIDDEKILLGLIVKSSAKKESLPGDVNLDGIINSKDYNLVMKYASKVKNPTASQKKYADINGDGKINTTDAKIIKRIYNTVYW